VECSPMNTVCEAFASASSADTVSGSHPSPGPTCPRVVEGVERLHGCQTDGERRIRKESLRCRLSLGRPGTEVESLRREVQVEVEWLAWISS
jgi:hypothetical protein